MSSTLTLWELLKRQQIVIPIIQRDYAQGRDGNEYVRRAFLREIKSCLGKADSFLTLDFVYGNEEHGRFLPLDGQQRLTTLWLIHWYIAFRSGMLQDDEVRTTLKKFTYETRVSSREFCEALCDKMPVSSEVRGSVAKYIKDRTWFFVEWLQDPTISAMLKMIGGNGTFSDDCIEEVFNKDEVSNKDIDFQQYWKRLIEDRYIRFELMVIGTEKLPIADDLYIKMNARGKQLTDFENFKADLVRWIQNQTNLSQEEKNKYAKELDNDWTDIFWNCAKEDLKEDFDGKIDASYFAFFNRFVLNELCLKKEKGEYLSASKFNPKRDEEVCDEKRGFDKLYGSEEDDTHIVYEGYEVYEKYLTEPALKKLETIFQKLEDKNIVNKIKEVFKGIKDVDSGGEYTFIPRYRSENSSVKLEKISQKGRIYFFAACQYLSLEKFNNDNFERWMRVVKNLTENGAVESIETMVACLRLINDLGCAAEKLEWDIYETLKQGKEKEEKSRLNAQYNEEIVKAKKIQENPSCEGKIKEAEQFGFFNGTIRFLYLDDKGDVDWDSFNTKFVNSEKIFKSNDKGNVPLSTVQAFLKLFDSFEAIENKNFFTTFGYRRRGACWKNHILCNKNYSEQVHNLLMKQEIITTRKNSSYNEFLESSVVGFICKKDENYRYRYLAGDDCIRKEYNRSECVYVSEMRLKKNQILIQLQNAGKIKIENEICDNYIWGDEIFFEFKNNGFCWKTDEKIYHLINENDKNPHNFIEWKNQSDDKLIADLAKISR